MHRRMYRHGRHYSAAFYPFAFLILGSVIFHPAEALRFFEFWTGILLIVIGATWQATRIMRRRRAQPATLTTNERDAVTALRKLGFAQHKSAAQVTAAAARIGHGATLQELIIEALKKN